MQSMAIDGFEQKAFESVKFDVTEKMKQLNNMLSLLISFAVFII